MVDSPPDKETLRKIWKTSRQELKKLFNTSGVKYRELGLKEKLADMSEEDQLELLASDGMLIKRPLVTDGGKISVGFKEDMFAEVWGK